jgi:importin subunit beta-1
VASRFLADVANSHFSDLAEAYPAGELADAFRQEWLLSLIKETRTNREFTTQTIRNAQWARELVKRQIGGSTGVIPPSQA